MKRAECALCATCSAARVRRAQCVQWTACTPCVVPAVNSVAGVQRVQCRACTACTVHPLDLCSVQWVQRVQPALRLHFSVACTMCNAYNVICAAYTMCSAIAWTLYQKVQGVPSTACMTYNDTPMRTVHEVPIVEWIPRAVHNV